MKNWKNLFDDIILMRGYDYYLDDAVDDIKEIDDGFEAIVHGSYDYTVTIGVDDGDVTYMECDCPYAEGGENCKHEAALLYELSAEGRLARTSFSKSLYSEGENDSEKILNTLKIEDLRAFLLDEIKCYPGIREHFIVAFANTLPKEYAVALEKEAERYINLINDYDEEEADYLDDWDDIGPLDDWCADLHDIAERIKPFTTDRKQYGNVFLLILNILNALSDYDDDVAQEYAEMLEQAYSSADNDEKSSLAEMARKVFEDNSNNADPIRDFLVDTVHDKDAAENLLLQAESMLKNNPTAESEYDKARAMIALGCPDDEIDRFLETCTGWPAVSLYSERLRNRKDWHSAARVINRAFDNLSPSYQKMAYDLLLDIWRNSGDDKEYNKELLNSILRINQLNLDKIMELKSRLSEPEWKQAYAEIIKSDSISFIRSDVLFEEKDWPELLAQMRRTTHSQHKDKYIDVLYPIYPDEVVAILKKDAETLGSGMNSRSSYHVYASYLRRLDSYPAGRKIAMAMAQSVIRNNPRKAALRDELRKAGFNC